jgi:hypothetical protein
MANKPVLHAHDHQHGGADPVRITWESTGEAGAGGGIQFDTYPQAGQWLYVETDGPDGSPSGFGVEVFDNSGNGIDLASHLGGEVLLQTVGGGDVVIQPSGNLVLTFAGGGLIIASLPGSDPIVPRALWVDSDGFVRVSSA